MLKIKEAIVVEGRYDKNTLAQLVDGLILTTSGFGIFKDRAQLELLRRVAARQGVVVLTDSDGAGFVIRNYLKGVLPPEQVKHAYIPDIRGKERRKAAPGREGKLGVEGMRPQVLEAALRQAGVEAAVFGVIRSHMDACLDAERLVRKLNAGRQGMERYRLMSRQAERIRERMRQAAGKKAGLYADFAERLIDGEEYAALSERYTKEAEALSAELERLLEERERYERDFHIEEGWEKTVRGFLGERELTQGMVDAFVTRVSVDREGNCEVVLAYDDMLAELLGAVREREAENDEG